MYSLVSASVLAVDLARHPSGTAVADVVDRVLALTPAELTALGEASRCSPAARERVLECCAGEQRAAGALQEVTQQVREAVAGKALQAPGTTHGLPPRDVLAAGSPVTAALTTALLGSLADLLDLLRREEPLCGAPASGVQASLDAVTAAWAGRRADLHDLAELRRPWAESVAPVPVSLPERPWSAALREVLDEVPHRTAEQWAQSVSAHRQGRRALRWSVGMHEACWAAERTARVRDVARAQLCAARVLRLAGASTGADAHAHGMVLTAAVQAVCLRDVIDTTALMKAWSAGS